LNSSFYTKVIWANKPCWASEQIVDRSADLQTWISNKKESPNM